MLTAYDHDLACMVTSLSEPFQGNVLTGEH